MSRFINIKTAQSPPPESLVEEEYPKLV